MDRVQQPQAEIERSKRLRGLGRYCADERFDAAASAVFVRSPHAHARILQIDATAAASMPGVLRVLTAGDCANLGNFPVIDRIGKAWQCRFARFWHPTPCAIPEKQWPV
jgi:CO/xanthine dehydrogenase Mo-binding subunit